jgi:superfamily I DNA/RNA helicase
MRKGSISTEALKVTPQALEGIKKFIIAIEELKKLLPSSTPSDFIEALVKKIQYRDHLVKEE